MTPSEHRQLFLLKLERNRAAREAAHASERRRPDGQWQGLIPGRPRGRMVVNLTRRAVAREIDAHYDAVAAIYEREMAARCASGDRRT